MIVTLLLGFAFGFLLQFARLNRYDTISGMAMLKDLTVAKAIALAIGIGAILINVEIALGLASFHVKPILLTGIIAGGLIFGMGMAILGYCPGTLAVSLGEGSLDAGVGILGALTAGALYTKLEPTLATLRGPDLGKVSLQSAVGESTIWFYLLLVLIGGFFIFMAFWMHRKEKSADLKWVVSGLGFALLNVLVFHHQISNRVIGASSTYPYLGDLLTGQQSSDYFATISGSGKWESWFLLGALLAGFLMAVIQKRFSFTLIHANWKQYKNNNKTSRLIWAFVGGFLLLIGARFAGGCTSGHVISGGMQLAASSLMFAVFVFAGLLITGRLFYRSV